MVSIPAVVPALVFSGMMRKLKDKPIMNQRKRTFATGSGNVFNDFGFVDETAVELTIKASLFRTLQKALRETASSQLELAAHLDAPQSKISNILNGKMAGFSVGCLAKHLLKLNYDICLSAQPAPVGATGRVFDQTEFTSSLALGKVSTARCFMRSISKVCK